MAKPGKTGSSGSWIVIVLIVCTIAVSLLLRQPEESKIDAPVVPERTVRSAQPVVIDDSTGIEFPSSQLLPGAPLAAEVVKNGKRTGVVSRIISPTSFMASVDSEEVEVTLAGVAPPGECGRADFNAEAERFLGRLLAGEDLLFEKQHGAAFLVYRARDRHNVNLAVLRNGYGCAGNGTLLLACPMAYVGHAESARDKGRGMWRDGAPLEDGYVPQSENAIALLRN